jgi:hypothetical protein
MHANKTRSFASSYGPIEPLERRISEMVTGKGHSKALHWPYHIAKLFRGKLYQYTNYYTLFSYRENMN